MEESQYNILLKKIEKLESRLDHVSDDVGRIDSDMADDRKQFGEMNISLKSLESSDEEIRNDIAVLQKRTTRSVEDAVTKAIKPLSNKLDEWVTKKVIRVRPNKRTLVEWFKDYWSRMNDGSWKDEVNNNGK